MRAGIVDIAEPGARPSEFAPLAYGFRPFFLLASLYAAGAIPAYLAWLTGFGEAPQRVPMFVWHAHEMLFGFAAAAMAGFLLTAVPNWTGARPIVGRRLAVLVLLWLAGRVAMALIDFLPWPLVAVADLAFIPALGLAVAPALIGSRNRRNYVFLGLVAVMTAANVLVHLDAGDIVHQARRGVFLALDAFLLMIGVVGGRIVPAFTANFLRQRVPGAAGIAPQPRLDIVCTMATSAIALADVTLGDAHPLTGIACLVAAAGLAARLVRWRTAATLGTPILLVLHVGIMWLILGLGLRGLALVPGLMPHTAALHVLTMGAVGTMVMGVMSRATLGHGGRDMRAPPAMVMAYALLALSVLARLVGATEAAAWSSPLLIAAGTLWTAAFGLFAGVIAPIVLLPRIDGRPG
jgi:uncharacterized protein involved in response to NO